MRKSESQPLIWIIDSEHWPRAFLRAELIERGYDAAGYQDLKSALTSLQLAPAKPRALVLELGGQEITPKEIQLLIESAIPIIVLGGLVELNEPFVRKTVWAAVLMRPVSLGGIADQVERIVPRHS
jgi:hypothetical protein